MADSEVEVAAAQVVAEVEPEREAMRGSEAPHDDGSASAAEEAVIGAGENKRKLEDVEPCDIGEEAPLKKQELSTEAPALAAVEPGSCDAEVAEGGLVDGSEGVKSGDVENVEPKMELTGTIDVNAYNQESHQGGEINGSVAADTDKELQELETLTMENGKVTPGENVESTTAPSADLSTTSRKIEVPNNKVGVLIGKAGETIKYLQFNSGAKIQIMRDAEADPHCTTRPVELLGDLQSINKAEKLIKDVIMEADAGGSPSLVARGFGTIQSGREELEIKVPNEKVGVIIGKGGETIKNLQTRSGARIQLIPQHLPDGDESKERSVRITGDKKQIESAKEMIKEVMNQGPRPSPLSGYNHQNYRPRGSTMGLSNWGPQAATAQSNMGYNHQQRGSFPPPTVQYPQPYGGFSHQAAPRGGFSGSWDQRSAAGPVHNAPSCGYDYYGQGGSASGNQASMPYPISGPSPTAANYGQSQAPNYGPPTSYGQPAPPQQNYGLGYNDSRYDSQAPSQQFYGQQTVGAQQGAYSQGTTPQPGYSQQQSYNKPSYGMPQDASQSYGAAPRTNQPGDPTYQGQAPSTYGSGTQQYPYGSGAPSQSAPPYNQSYGPASAAADGYTQPPSVAYTQQSGQAAAPGYSQTGQPMPAYAQPTSQPAGYGQYATTQQGYGDPASSNIAYGNPVPGSGYAAPPAGGSQSGYGGASNPSGYY